MWILVLALLGALLYVNQIGLPGFAKKPLLENLRGRGVDLQFSRLRLSWQRGIVAEDVAFGQADSPSGPQLTATQVRLKLNHRALLRLRLQIDGVVLRQGRLSWQVEETNQAPRQITVKDIETEVNFLPEDEWSLDEFNALFAGARIQASGTVAHASAIRQWKFLKPREAAPAGQWRSRSRAVADLLEQIKFTRQPNLAVDIRGDARDLTSFRARLLLTAAGAETPWGTVERGWLGARLFPADTNGLSSAQLTMEAGEARTRWGTAQQLQISARVHSFESLTNLGEGALNLSAAGVQTEWGKATNLRLALHGNAVEGHTNLISAELGLQAGQAQTRWASATNLAAKASWVHAFTNAIPLTGQASLNCEEATTEYAAARQVQLRLHGALTNAPQRADATWAGWGRLEPYVLGWQGKVTGLRSQGLELGRFECSGSWQAPLLSVTNLHAELDQRSLQATGTLDVATRQADLNVASGLDPHSLMPLIPQEAQRWLKACSWPEPPSLNVRATLMLPPWTNPPPEWRATMQQTAQLEAAVTFEKGASYQEVSVSSAQAQASYSDSVLRVGQLALVRPEGRLDLSGETDTRDQQFHASVSSTLDLRAIRPLLSAPAQRTFDLFSFTEAPVIEAEARGRLDSIDYLGVTGRLALTNFTFRQQSIGGLQTAVQYSNRFLRVIGPRVQRGSEQMSADGLAADFTTELIYLTNGISTAEPMVVARAIGAHVAEAVEDYQFKQPPRARVNGIIPMHGEDAADLHFDLDGGPFEWWHFRVPYVNGHVHWQGQHLHLTNMWMQFYGGQASGEAHFDFTPGGDTDYRFNLAMTDSLMHPLVEDVFVKTNNLEGRVNGTLIVARANTSTINSWEGHGDLSLRDGFIWDIPIFGVFSSVLNTMKPGLGSSRASAGSCTFTITNGVIRTEDMDIRSTGMRLQYRGTLDFEGQVNARVEAEALRDTWLVGPLVSTVLWPVTKLFEYKVTGPLDNPSAEPVHLIPKVMLLPFQLPFHPWRSIKGLLPETGASRTNTPSTAPQK